MKKLFWILLLGFLLLFLESLPPSRLAFKPDLLLLLVVSLGLRQTWLTGGIAALLLGILRDCMSGTELGLHGLVFLLLFFTVRAMAGHLNSESPLLLMFLVLTGTLWQSLLLIFIFVFLTESSGYWVLLLKQYPFQALVNLAVTGAFLMLAGFWRRGRQRGARRPGSLLRGLP